MKDGAATVLAIAVILLIALYVIILTGCGQVFGLDEYELAPEESCTGVADWCAPQAFLAQCGGPPIQCSQGTCAQTAWDEAECQAQHPPLDVCEAERGEFYCCLTTAFQSGLACEAVHPQCETQRAAYEACGGSV